jgi:hypothetical protein
VGRQDVLAGADGRAAERGGVQRSVSVEIDGHAHVPHARQELRLLHVEALEPGVVRVTQHERARDRGGTARVREVPVEGLAFVQEWEGLDHDRVVGHAEGGGL